jgi:hypothetical protein
MQDHPTSDDEAMDNTVLGRLYEAGPLSEAELIRQYDVDGIDSLRRLTEMGLAHKLDDGFAIISAAGRHAHDIDPSWN